MLMLDYRDIGWWYWLVTGVLLIGGIATDPQFFVIAIIVTAIHTLHYIIREHSASSYPVQIRIFILLLLLISYPEPMRLLYWAPTLGAIARVFFGYCLTARFLSLFPWNRSEALSFAYVHKAFFTPPTKGNIRHGLPETEDT